jgi:hypothetical protein
MIKTVFLISILCVWFMASVLDFIFPALRKRLPYTHIFFEMPRCRLFVPRISHYHLLYRDRLADGTISRWQPAALWVKKSLVRLIWNPQLWRVAEVLWMLGWLKRLTESENPSAIQSTIPYKILLNHISGLPKPPLSAARQFMVMEGGAHIPQYRAQAFFISEFQPW